MSTPHKKNAICAILERARAKAEVKRETQRKNQEDLEQKLNEARGLIQSTVGGLTFLVNKADISGPQIREWYELEDKMLEFLKRTEAQQ